MHSLQHAFPLTKHEEFDRLRRRLALGVEGRQADVSGRCTTGPADLGDRLI